MHHGNHDADYDDPHDDDYDDKDDKKSYLLESENYVFLYTSEPTEWGVF